jgi:hypothetical protein
MCNVATSVLNCFCYRQSPINELTHGVAICLGRLGEEVRTLKDLLQVMRAHNYREHFDLFSEQRTEVKSACRVFARGPFLIRCRNAQPIVSRLVCN